MGICTRGIGLQLLIKNFCAVEITQSCGEDISAQTSIHMSNLLLCTILLVPFSTTKMCKCVTLMLCSFVVVYFNTKLDQ